MVSFRLTWSNRDENHAQIIVAYFARPKLFGLLRTVIFSSVFLWSGYPPPNRQLIFANSNLVQSQKSAGSVDFTVTSATNDIEGLNLKNVFPYLKTKRNLPRNK